MSRDREIEKECMTELARFTTLEALALALLDRRKRLGLSQLLVDEIGGLQIGYTGKIEAEAKNPGRGKGLGKTSIPLLLGALKVDLVLMPATSQHRDKKHHSEDFFTRRARKARAAQLAEQTPKQRKKIARAAAKARWRAVKAERERKD